MQAVVLRQFGEPKTLKVEEIPTPKPAAGEVLVQVRAASINPSDVKNVAGHMQGTTLPRVPGRDFAGVVSQGPSELIGREVFGTGGDIGYTRDGSHAQYLLLPPGAVVAKPTALSIDAAGSAGLTFLTAWYAVVTAAKVAAGEKAVVIGAAGGVGSAAVQIAAARGARVIGIVRSDSEIQKVRKMGADEVLNSRTQNVADAVKSLVSGGANVVFDTTGAMFAEAIDMSAHGGRVPVITAPADGKATFNLRNLYRKVLTVCGVDTRALDAVASAAVLAEMVSYFESGQFQPTPGEAMPLSSAAEAYEAASHGRRITFRMT